MMAVQRQRPQPDLIQHSDRGIQYACTDYQDALAATGIWPSMCRRGNALDNAPMESFFRTLKTELVTTGPTPPTTRLGATCSPTWKASTTGNARTRG